MAWINVAPIVLSIIAILFMPGFLVSTIAFPGSSLILRLAQAPAWSVGIVAIWSILGSFLPYRWGLTPFIGFTFVVLLAVWMISQTPIGQTVANMIPANNQPSKHTARRLIATVFVWVIVILPLVLYSNPYDIIQGVDSSYHYNQLWLMEQTGNASPLTSNASMGGLSPRGWYYPNTWHALLSLVTKGPSQAYVVANAFLLAIPLIWLVGIGAWSVATTGRNSMYEWSFVGSALAPIAMIRLEIPVTLWPFALGMAVLPGIMAVWYFATRAIRRHTSVDQIIKSLLSVGVMTSIPIAGLVGIHPSTMLPPTFAFFVYLVFELIRVGIKMYRGGNVQSFARHISGAMVLVYTLLLIVDGPFFTRRILFHRFPNVGWDNAPQKLFASVSLFMPEGGAVTLAFYVVVFFIVLAALVVAFWKRRWIMFSGWLSQWLLIIWTFFPVPGLSRITSLYYNYPNRPKTALAIFVVPLIALLAQTIWDELCDRHAVLLRSGIKIAVIGITTVVAYVWISPGIVADVRNAFYPRAGYVTYMASHEELAMLRRAQEKLPGDAVVLGDPSVGTVLLQPLSGVKVVWPFMYFPNNRDDKILLDHFKEIDSNGHVCDILERNGIEYFYADLPVEFNGAQTDLTRPGLYNVPLQKGFEKVDQGGSAAIYKINFCSSPDRPDYYPYERTATTCILEGEQGACIE